VSTFGHGGTNRVMQIHNTGTATNSQSHVILTSDNTTNVSSAVGSVSFGLPSISTGQLGRIAHIGASTGSAHTVTNPSGYLSFATKNTSDATAIERLRVTEAGIIQDAAGNELGWKNIPPNTSGFVRGGCFVITAGTTINTAQAGGTYSIYNNTGSSLTITQGAGVTMHLGGTTATGNRTILPNGFATVWFIDASNCVINGNIT
jgi:hypothetical protein